MHNEEMIQRRMRELDEAGFYVKVCEKCSGGVRYAGMRVCPTCKGYGIIAGPPKPLPLRETQRATK
jgi:uncharacterized OB-fold protein